MTWYRKLKVSKESLIEAHSKGLTDRSIGRLFGVQHCTIAQYRKRYGLEPNGPRSKKINKVDEYSAKCCKCSQIKSVEEFGTIKKGGNEWYKSPSCNECRGKVAVKSVNKNIRSYLSVRLRQQKARCAAKGWVCSISLDDLVQLFEQQGGKCFYTNVYLDWGYGKGYRRNALSIDCIVRAHGYIAGNVVLCTNKANTVKSDLTLTEIQEWLPSWYEKVLKFMKISNSKSK